MGLNTEEAIAPYREKEIMALLESVWVILTPIGASSVVSPFILRVNCR